MSASLRLEGIEDMSASLPAGDSAAVNSSALVHAPGSDEQVAQILGWLKTLAKTPNGGDVHYAAHVQCSDGIRCLLESIVAGSMQAIRGLEKLLSKVVHNWKGTNTELELFVFIMEGLPTLIAAAPAADSPDYQSRTRPFQLLETVLETIFAHGYTTRLGELPVEAAAAALGGLLEEDTYRSKRVFEIMIDARHAVEPSLFLEAPKFAGAAKAYLLRTLMKGSLGLDSKQAKLLQVMGLSYDYDETLACALKSYMAPAGRVDFLRAFEVIRCLCLRMWDLQGYDSTIDRAKDTHKSVSALPVLLLAELAVSLMKAWKNQKNQQHPGGFNVGVYVVGLVKLLAEADEHSDSRRTLDVVRMLTTDGMLEQVIENAEYDAMQPDGNPYSQMNALSAMIKASPPGYRGYIGKKIMTSPSCLKSLARWMSLVHDAGEEKGLPWQDMRCLTQPLDPFQRGKLFDAFAAHHESAELSTVLTRASPIAGILRRAQRDYATHQLGDDLQAATYCPEKGDRKKSEPNARMLVRCANRAGLINEPALESILEKFAGVLDAVRARREAHRAETEGSKYEIGLEIKRLYAGARSLRNLEEAWRTTAWKEFRAGINALRDGAADTMTQLLGAAGGSGTTSTSLPSAPVAPLLLTGPPQADVSMTAPAAPLLLTGPAPSGVSSGVSEASMEATARAHLRARTERVPDCGGCEVLRTEPAARANFSKRMANGDRGGWCLLHAHKISMARLEAMVGEVAPTLTAPAKRKLAQAFMDEEYGISEVLSSKQPKVTLYGGADGTTQVGSDGQPSKTARHSSVYGGVREVASM